MAEAVLNPPLALSNDDFSHWLHIYRCQLITVVTVQITHSHWYLESLHAGINLEAMQLVLSSYKSHAHLLSQYFNQVRAMWSRRRKSSFCLVSNIASKGKTKKHYLQFLLRKMHGPSNICSLSEKKHICKKDIRSFEYLLIVREETHM